MADEGENEDELSDGEENQRTPMGKIGILLVHSKFEISTIVFLRHVDMIIRYPSVSYKFS